MSKKHNMAEICIIALIFAFIIISFSVYGYGASIHGDEYFSIGFANNSEDFLFVTLGKIDQYGEDGWIDGQFLHDWLSVQPGEQFAIMDIHRNVRDDVHPPLYFMLLNIISSFFVDKVTLVPGYIINVCSGIVECIFIYLISNKIFSDKRLAYVPVMVWAASNAASITMTYIRMYGPLCALCLLWLYLNFVFLEKEKTDKSLYFLIGSVVTIGTLTHYYFYIWLFVVVCIVLVLCIKGKKIKDFLIYCVCIFIGEIVSICAYPYVFRHLLFSERGVQAQNNLWNTSFEYYIDFLGKLWDTINRFVYSNQFSSMLFVFCCLCITAVGVIILRRMIYGRENKNIQKYVIKGSSINIIILAVTVIGYFLILSKISYSANWMYLCPIFAPLLIMTVYAFAKVLCYISPKYYSVIMFAICCSILLYRNIPSMRNSIADHEKTKQRHEQVVRYSNNCDVIFYYSEWNNLYDNQILELMEFNQIRAIPIDEMDNTDYQAVLSTRKNNNDLMLYIPSDVDNYQSKINDVINELNADEVTVVLEDSHALYYVKL